MAFHKIVHNIRMHVNATTVLFEYIFVYGEGGGFPISKYSFHILKIQITAPEF